MFNRFKYKLASILTALVMMLGLLPGTVYAAEKPKIKKATYYNTGTEPSFQIEYEDPDNSDLNMVEVYLLGEKELKEGDLKPQLGYIEIDGKKYGILGIQSIDITNKDHFYKDPSTGRWILKKQTFYLAGEKKPDPGQNVLIAVEPMHVGYKIPGYITPPVKVKVPTEGDSVTVEGDGGSSIKDCSIEVDENFDLSYSGVNMKPTLVVKNGNKKLKEGTDFEVVYPTESKNAGTYKATVKGTGSYSDQRSFSYTIVKAKNSLKTSYKNKKKGKVLKKVDTDKKNATFDISDLIGIATEGQGTVTYVKAKGNSKISISKAGKVTVKKGIKKGLYRVKVNVKAAGDNNYNAITKKMWVNIRVRK